MKAWTIVALALSAATIALGIELGSGAMRAAGSALVIFGGAAAAVCITLWAAKALGFGKASRLHRRDSARVDAAIAQLTTLAQQASDRGVLTLADAAFSDRRDLFRAGVEMLIAAEPPLTIRSALTGRADRESAAMHTQRASLINACRIVPIVSVALAVAMLAWMLVQLSAGHAPAELGSLTPLALIITVYGSFAVAAIATEYGDRLSSASAEDELVGALVIETILAIRTGESPERVAAMLRGLTPPQTTTVPEPLRRAA